MPQRINHIPLIHTSFFLKKKKKELFRPLHVPATADPLHPVFAPSVLFYAQNLCVPSE